MRHYALHTARRNPRLTITHQAIWPSKVRVGTPSTAHAFIVRLKHRSRQTVEYLAADGNFSLAELTLHRREAWRFPHRKAAAAAVRSALGFALEAYIFEIRPASAA